MSDESTLVDCFPTGQRLMHTSIHPTMKVKVEHGYDGATHFIVPNVGLSDALPLVSCVICGAVVHDEPHVQSQHVRWHNAVKPWGVA